MDDPTPTVTNALGPGLDPGVLSPPSQDAFDLAMLASITYEIPVASPSSLIKAKQMQSREGLLADKAPDSSAVDALLVDIQNFSLRQESASRQLDSAPRG
ncbi:hypothetical protein OWV82_018752 [Melia azedarach]|uniref:Uncharacterized protein n=1 Tax=Melia azedarach TaxID=155640 RepID=A0ACC1XBJ6_MELAZ|nr:hypothetical protein OWV82_018752 [Melia azedarach]